MAAIAERHTVHRDASLTAREIDVLRLLSLGCTYARAAERLGLSAHTVASHVKKIYGKLGVHAVGAAVMSAMKLGIIE
jgi:DNA-binding CsgD family transcriptional regulator